LEKGVIKSIRREGQLSIVVVVTNQNLQYCNTRSVYTVYWWQICARILCCHVPFRVQDVSSMISGAAATTTVAIRLLLKPPRA